MGVEELTREEKRIYALYKEECEKNGGREGTTNSFYLRAQLDIIEYLFLTYFNIGRHYKRFI